MPGRVLQNLISPVPSDIDIAQSIPPLPIKDIAAGVGLTDDDYDMHGKYKGKVCALDRMTKVAHSVISDL